MRSTFTLPLLTKHSPAMTNNDVERNSSPVNDVPFKQVVSPLLTDLLYPSESDEPLETVSCYLDQPEPLTVSQIKDWQMLPPSVYVEERPEAEFWELVVTEQDWYGDEENARTASFQKLHAFITTTLTNRQVFYVGQSEMDVYLLGQSTTGERVGIKTKVVQT